MLSSRGPTNNTCILLEFFFSAEPLQAEEQEMHQTRGWFECDDGQLVHPFQEGELELRWQTLGKP